MWIDEQPASVDTGFSAVGWFVVVVMSFFLRGATVQER
jgi:hypothetical protein